MTEAELKDEVIARIAAEKQLNAAEKALEHLEMALKLSGAQMSELQEQIMPDVRKLRGKVVDKFILIESNRSIMIVEFFEECAKEARLDANKPIIMKNAVYARRSIIRRSKTRFLRSSLRRSTTNQQQRISGISVDEKSNGTEQNNGGCWSVSNAKESSSTITCNGTISSIAYITDHL